MKNIFVLFAFVSGMLVTGSSLADTDKEEVIRKGQEHFKIFCVNCHGVNADGKGPLTETMQIAPYDLTALNQTSDEICLAERVLKAIAGVHEVVQGQEHNMPTFSGNLEAITIYELTQYLKSIQK